MPAVSDPISTFLLEQKAAIVAEWERRTRAIPPARELSRPVLLDRVPELLDRIAAISGALAKGRSAEVPLEEVEDSARRLEEALDLGEVVRDLSTLRASVLSIWERDPTRPTAPLRALSEAIDRLLGASVDRYTTARERALRALDRISMAGFEHRELPDLLHHLLHLLLESVPSVDTGIIMLREGDRLVTRAAVGLEERARAEGFSVAVGEGFAGRVAASKAPMLLRSAAGDATVKSPILRAHGVRALYGVPLVEEGNVIGVAKMGSLTADDFPEPDRLLLNALAARATAIIRRQLLLDALAARSQELDRARDQLEVILRGVSDAIIAVAPSGEILYANETAARHSGYPSAAALMSASLDEVRTHYQLFDEAGAPVPPEERPLSIAFREKRPVEKVLRSREWSSGGLRWIRGAAVPILTETGVRMAIAIWSDVTDAKREEDRRTFLADAMTELAESLDFRTTLSKIARLAVPRIADWCAVDLVVPHGLETVATAHVDPAREAWAAEIRRKYPPDPSVPHGIAQVIRSGDAELLPDLTDAILAARVKEPEFLEAMRGLEMRSYLCVPIRTPKHTFGAITLVTAESERRYDATDLAFAEDFGKRAALAIENATLYQESVEANRRKDEFLAMLAHELRNPLAPLMHAAAVMRAKGTSAPAVADVVDRQVRHLSRLVDDLLEVSRITRGRITLHRERVDLKRLLDEVVRDSAERAYAAGLTLAARLPPEPVWVDGDRTRLSQIVMNLVSNAIKFTERGGQITVSLDEHEGFARIAVRDTGIGIDPKLLPRIFDAFTQADRSLDRSRGGLGLGLTVVKGLTELHGGTVSASSDGPGRGAELSVRLPIASPREESRRRGERPAGRPLQILVVEDNRDAADMLREVLVERGHTVEVRYSGEQVAELARRLRPDVILCDLGLPRKDGYAVAAELQADPATRDIPLIAVSGYGTAEDQERTHAAGFDFHLTKPVDPGDLDRFLAELAEASP